MAQSRSARSLDTRRYDTAVNSRDVEGDDGRYGRFVNPRWARVLRLLGCDRAWTRGEGAHLIDARGERVIDAIAGYGAASVGHRHPRLVSALRRELEHGAPGMVHFGIPPLAGALAERLLQLGPPSLGRVLFTNSGAEGIEAALKLARAATGRTLGVSCDRGFHGFTTGALSLVGVDAYREGFGALLPSRQVPFGDLEALERALAPRDAAAFVVEPVQGKGVHAPPAGYLAEAQRLCRRSGTLLVIDEVQTGIGRCGSMFACTDLGADEPDLLVTSKALSGGMVPVGAVLARERIWSATFSSIERALVHSSTFHQSPLAMRAGLTVLDIVEDEALVARSARLGERLHRGLEALRPRHRSLGEVRGRGLMIAFDLVPVRPLRGRMESMLWPQGFAMALLAEGRVLAQVVNQRSATIKLTPPLVIDDAGVDAVIGAVDGALSRADDGVLDASLGTAARMAMNLLGRRGGAPRPVTRSGGPPPAA